MSLDSADIFLDSTKSTILTKIFEEYICVEIQKCLSQNENAISDRITPNYLFIYIQYTIKYQINERIEPKCRRNL